jgi:hypothetical protein
MSELKSRPPVKQKQNLDAFIEGANGKSNSSLSKSSKEVFPWEQQGVRADVTKVYNLRLSEPYLLKLKYIAEHTPDSMQKFCIKAMQKAIDSEIEKLIR